MKQAMVDYGPYFILVLVGFLPNEIWRWVGLLTARRLDESSELVTWSRLVAIAILAGVIAKLLLFSAGELAGIPLAVRLGAAGCALIGYLAMRRSVYAGVFVGEAALLIGGYIFTR